MLRGALVAFSALGALAAAAALARRRRRARAALAAASRVPAGFALPPRADDDDGEPRRVLCFGDSNTWGFRPFDERVGLRRLGAAERYPRALARALGRAWEVAEAGLNSRTTAADDAQVPWGHGVNGRAQLAVALATAKPLDLVVVMLGTNDLKPHLGRELEAIADGAAAVAADVRACAAAGPRLDGGRAPRDAPAVLLVAPARVRLSAYTEPWGFARDAPERSAALAPLLRARADALAAEVGGVAFLDAGLLFEIPDPAVHGGDGIHISADNARALGEAVAQLVRAAPASPLKLD